MHRFLRLHETLDYAGENRAIFVARFGGGRLLVLEITATVGAMTGPEAA